MRPSRPLPRAFYRRPAEQVARELLGRFLVRRWRGRRLVAQIVETEAYLGVYDRASHAWQGRRTKRNRALFEPGGVAYVYLIYGIYHCFNAVTGELGDGSAVLVRAAEPLVGIEVMQRRRRLRRPVGPGDIAGGPGKLCQAMAIDGRFTHQPLYRGELLLTAGRPAARGEIATGARVGVDYAGEAASWPLRFAIRGNRHVSTPFPW